MAQTLFDYEKFNVYREAVTFVAYANGLLDGLPKFLAVIGQLDRASTSIPLNIAEGNGKHTPADRCRYFDIARGSSLECAVCLDVLDAENVIDSSVALNGKRYLVDIVSMLVGLIRANSDTRDV